MSGFYAIARALEILERNEVITTDPSKAEECCGNPRDEEGFCQHREYHPVYVDLNAQPPEA